MAINDKAVTDPLFEPGAPNDLKSALLNFDESIRMKTRVLIPVAVYDYKRDSKYVTVIPLTKYAYRNGKIKYIRRQPFSVTRLRFSQGFFAFDIPLFKGETGWVIASDRDTMSAKGGLKKTVLQDDRQQNVLEDEYEEEPQYSDFHYYQEGVFIPDNWGDFEFSRCKDLEEPIDENAAYFGTGFDTIDKYQTEKLYEKRDSSCIVFNRNGKVTVANSLPSDGDDNHNGFVEIDKAKVRVKSVNKTDDEKTVEMRLDYTDGSFSVKNGKGVEVSFDSEENLTVKNTKISITFDQSGNLTISADGDVSFSAGGTMSISASLLNLNAGEITLGGHTTMTSGANILGSEVTKQPAQEGVVTFSPG